jgi:hypothetical protein
MNSPQMSLIAVGPLVVALTMARTGIRSAGFERQP